MKSDIDNMISLLISNGFDFNYLIHQHEEIVGVFPKFEETTKGLRVSYNSNNPDHTFQEYLKNINITEKSFTYISLYDFYIAMNRYGYNFKSLKFCYNLLSRIYMKLMKHLNFDQFDHIITFSDHGFKLELKRF